MKKECDRAAFEAEVRELLKNPDVRRMAEFEQHNGNTTLRHVLTVAEASYRIAERLGLDIDEKALARGAIMHDYYLYTVKETDISAYRHGISHPEEALQNARKVIDDLTEKEENIIRSHMWPLTLFHPPKSNEAIAVTLADKYCAIREMIFRKRELRPKKQAQQHYPQGADDPGGEGAGQERSKGQEEA